MDKRVVVKVVKSDGSEAMGMPHIPFGEEDAFGLSDGETQKKKRTGRQLCSLLIVFLVSMLFACIVAYTLYLRGFDMVHLLGGLKWYTIVMGGLSVWMYSNGESFSE